MIGEYKKYKSLFDTRVRWIIQKRSLTLKQNTRINGNIQTCITSNNTLQFKRNTAIKQLNYKHDWALLTHCIIWNQLPTSLRISHPNYSSPSQRPSFEHAGLTCYTLLTPSITFSLFHSELKTYLFQKILSSTLVCFCLSDWSHGSRPFTGLICSSVLCFSSIFSVLVIPKCGRLSWPAL